MKNTSIPYFSVLIATLALSQACASYVEPECESNDRRCNANSIETCVNQFWEITTPCNADICSIDAQGNPFCKPANNCLSKCADSILSLCQSDGSISIENCTNKSMICGLLDDGTPSVCRQNTDLPIYL